MSCDWENANNWKKLSVCDNRINGYSYITGYVNEIEITICLTREFFIFPRYSVVADDITILDKVKDSDTRLLYKNLRKLYLYKKEEKLQKLKNEVMKKICGNS